MRPATSLYFGRFRGSAQALLALLVAGSLAACAGGDGEEPEEPAADPNRYETTLSGDDIGPQPGDEDGEGDAVITLDTDENRVCGDITVRKVEEINTIHLHSGTLSEGGPIVLEFERPVDGASEGCVDAPAQLIANIRRAPGDFFVNVRSREHPAGAVRGALPGRQSNSPGTPPNLPTSKPTSTSTSTPTSTSTSTTG